MSSVACLFMSCWHHACTCAYRKSATRKLARNRLPLPITVKYLIESTTMRCFTPSSLVSMLTSIFTDHRPKRKRDVSDPTERTETCADTDVSATVVQAQAPLNSLSNASTEFVSLTMPHSFADKPPRPEFTPFTVPYLGVYSLPGQNGFWAYPEHHGWIIHAKDMNCHVLCPPGICRHGKSSEDIDRDLAILKPPIFSRADGMPIQASDKVAFLQAWLFFGLITEVSALCGLEIDVEAEFIINTNSVSTEKLNGLPGRWFKAALRTHRAGDIVLMNDVLALLRHSILLRDREFIDVDNHIRLFSYSDTEARVLFSIEVLARVIGLHLLLHVYMPGFTATDETGWIHNRILKSVDWLYRRLEGLDELATEARKRMEEQGWCESELSLLATDEMFFASLITRPRIRNHSGCEDVICNAYQTDEATYMTRHTQDGCNCGFVGIETSVLVDVLSRDKVPILVITEQLEIQVLAENEAPYIALSHVWADGLGNPIANALPSCQLRRLRDFVNKLYRIYNPASTSSNLPVGLWMDTLCIPVHPSAKLYRKKAIQLLGKTFNEANAVLVLDRELEIVESASVTFMELGLRILCSGWAKRLWTLQEATLASEAHNIDKIYFQMLDGPFLYQKYDRARPALRGSDTSVKEIQAEERTLLYEDGIMLLLGEQIPSLRAMSDMRTGWSPFRVIYAAIEHRSTSKADDVPLCITSLLGKDLSTILAATSMEQRMANFYVLMREIPCGVMWCDRPEKLNIKPFRWAPLSITACPQTAYAGWKDGICDTAGLHVRYRGFIFSEDQGEHDAEAMLPHIFDIASVETGEVVVRLNSQQQYCQVPFQRNLALIFRTNDRNVFILPDVAIVVVEDNTEINNEIQLTEIVCRIVGYTDMFNLPSSPSDSLAHPVIRGHPTVVDQMWCIT